MENASGSEWNKLGSRGDDKSENWKLNAVEWNMNIGIGCGRGRWMNKSSHIVEWNIPSTTTLLALLPSTAPPKTQINRCRYIKIITHISLQSLLPYDDEFNENSLSDIIMNELRRQKKEMSHCYSTLQDFRPSGTQHSTFVALRGEI